MAHVTIPDTSPRVQYTVGGTSTTDFSIPYAYFEESDIVVYVDDTLKTLTTDYTITGTAVDEGYSGGTVVLNTGVTNVTVTVIRDVPAERITDFPTNGPFNITQLNSELDRMTAALQQEETSHDLYLKVAEYDTYTNLTLPVKDTRKGTVLGFNATTGDPEAGPTIADVSTLAAITADIATLADIEDGTDATDAISDLAAIKANVTTVAGIASNVTSVAGNATNINTVAADGADIGTVATNIASVNTVATNIADVVTVANDLNEAISEVETVADDLNEAISEIEVVANNIANVNTVGTNISNVNTVAGISSDVTAVAADATDIGTVSTNIANVNTVAGISANVTTVAGVDTEVTTVAGISANVSTVAGISANVTTVAGISSNVTTVAGNTSNINQVASDTAVINSASANATAAATSATSAANSATAAATSAAQANAVVQGTAAVRHSIRPSLLLDFANSKTLDPRIDFTRSSTATYYDGKTHAKAEENLLKYSQEFDNTVWGKNSASIVITANASSAPDGTTTAERFYQGTLASAGSYIGHNVNILAGNRYVFSVYAKYIDDSLFELIYSESNTNYAGAEFDIQNGTTSIFDSGLDVAISSSITDVGNGWYRCVLIFDCGVSGDNFFIAHSDGTTSRSVRGFRAITGDGTSSLYIWGAQLEQRSSVTAYTPTTSQPITNYIPVLQTAASGTARFDHDPVTGESKGLLIEEQRTNLIDYSEAFATQWSIFNSGMTLTADAAIAPDGTQTATKVSDDTSYEYKFISKTSVAAGTYSYSAYFKNIDRRYAGLCLYSGTANVGLAVFDLQEGEVAHTHNVGYATSISADIYSVGNGWYRCVANIVTTNNLNVSLFLSDAPIKSYVPRYTGDNKSVLIWGAQLEAGSFPTSYIPTSGSQVTRSADSASMTGDNFSSWYRQDEMSWYADFSAPLAPANGSFVFDAGSDVTNRIGLFLRDTGAVTYYSVQDNNTSAALSGSTAVRTTESAKAAFAAKTNDGAISLDGATVITDDVGLLPFGANRLYIGRRQDNGSYLTGTIKKIAYYPVQLTDAELTALTED